MYKYSLYCSILKTIKCAICLHIKIEVKAGCENKRLI